jgi:hypothetical protein
VAYTCHLCNDAEPATVLITPLKGGDTMAIGADCMVTGLCGLLSVATQVDPEQLYDMIIKLRADAESDALVPDGLATERACGQVSAKGNSPPCVRPAGHKGNHSASDGSQWRISRTEAPAVTESEPASA